MWLPIPTNTTDISLLATSLGTTHNILPFFPSPASPPGGSSLSIPPRSNQRKGLKKKKKKRRKKGEKKSKENRGTKLNQKLKTIQQEKREKKNTNNIKDTRGRKEEKEKNKAPWYHNFLTHSLLPPLPSLPFPTPLNSPPHHPHPLSKIKTPIDRPTD